MSIYLNTYGYREHFTMQKKICSWSYLIINFSKTKNLPKKMYFIQIARSKCSQIQFTCAKKSSLPDSNLFRKLNFENRPISSKVTTCVEILKIALVLILPAKFVTFEPADRFSKFDFLDKLESGKEHFSAHKL